MDCHYQYIRAMNYLHEISASSESNHVPFVMGSVFMLSPSVVSNSLWPCGLKPTSSSVHGVSKQEYWNGLTFPIPGDRPKPRIEPKSLVSPTLTGRLKELYHWCQVDEKIIWSSKRWIALTETLCARSSANLLKRKPFMYSPQCNRRKVLVLHR